MSDGEMYTAIHSIAPFGVSPIVRLPSSEGWLIKRALDAGAHGIAIPMVSTPVSGTTEITILPRRPS
jgi:4-hydroxy-2-oxoheptanedioate aldolase